MTRNKDVVEFWPYHRLSDLAIKSILDDAAKDPFLGSFVYKKDVKAIIAFVVDSKVVGFAIPRKDSDGHMRTGPIFVKPDHRRKNIASLFVEYYFSIGKGKGRAWIEETNTASQKLFRKVGFVKTSKSTVDNDGVTLFEWIKSN